MKIIQIYDKLHKHGNGIALGNGWDGYLKENCRCGK